METLHTLTLGDIARENRRSWPLATAVVDGDVRLTYEELDERVDRLANCLVAGGVSPGDRILWLGHNSFRILECLLAAARTGAVFCPVNWRQSVEELAFVVRDLGPRVVVWDAAASEAVASLRTIDSDDARWIAADDEGAGGYEAWLASAKAGIDDLDIAASTPCLALYTAAFDGRPNAALLSHTAILSHNLALALQRQIETGFVYLNSGPLFHVGTLMFCTATFHLGGTNVFMPAFDPVEACRLIEAEQCQSMLLFPPMVDQLADANRDLRFDLTSLRATAGSEAWNAMITIDDSPWGRSLGGYGQTEVGGMLTYTGLGIGGMGTHGRPSPFVQLRIVGADGAELPAEQVGEIVARGPHVMSGYHDRPTLNAVKQQSGWHHTGDLGRREKDGTISFIGPKLRMIKSGGENVYPAEVEACIKTHPAVEDCAVIGVPDERWGQGVKAIVVRRGGEQTSAEDIVEHCQRHIASYKKPRSVEFADAIVRRGFTPDYDVLDEQFGGGGYPIY